MADIKDFVDPFLGLLGLGGTAATNKTNRAIAREQMAFQERMSSTAAQRAVEDFRKAGLNPALAFDRQASSPGGASTTVADPIERGISTALAARRARAELKLLATQERAETFRGEQAATQAELNEATATNVRQKTNFEADLQPSALSLAATRALFERLTIPGMKNQADFEEKLGTMHPALKFLFNSGKSLTSMIQGVRGK